MKPTIHNEQRERKSERGDETRGKKRGCWLPAAATQQYESEK